MAPVKPFLSDRATRRWQVMLWLGLYAITAAALAGGLVGSSVPGGNFGMMVPAGLACAFIGVGWLIALVIVVEGQHGRLSGRGAVRWLAIPLAGVLSLALVVTNAPLRARFELSHAALDRAAARLESGRPLDSSSIGQFSVVNAWVNSPGESIFQISDGDPLFGACGLAHTGSSYQGADPNLGTRLADDWYVWCEYMD